MHFTRRYLEEWQTCNLLKIKTHKIKMTESENSLSVFLLHKSAISRIFLFTANHFVKLLSEE